MKQRPSGLEAIPLKRVSPTINEVLRTCFLRVAFGLDPSFSEIKTASTYASLGSVSHRLLETACRGDFDLAPDDSVEKTISDRWRELVVSEVESLQSLVIKPVPSPVKWPKYALRMVAACNTALRIVNQRKEAHSISATVPSACELKSEVWYEGYDGKLIGRIDLIHRDHSGIQIVDYKSGLVMENLDPNGGSQQIREPYVRQMLLYAALIHDNEGEWPTKALIESLIDGAHEIKFTPEAAQDAVYEALYLLDKYNHKVDSGIINGAPSPNTCLWCNFKPICVDFIKAADISWAGPTRTIIGQVTTIKIDPPQFCEVKVLGGNHEKGIAHIHGITSGMAMEIKEVGNSQISLSNLKPTPGTTDLLFTWSSMCWRWSSKTT
ncbi:MAG: PD-(D/E)XK nuclease family protein [Dehalococcoidia bacterium]